MRIVQIRKSYANTAESHHPSTPDSALNAVHTSPSMRGKPTNDALHLTAEDITHRKVVKDLAAPVETSQDRETYVMLLVSACVGLN